jgi:phosphoglycolate phosphatase
MIRNVVFDLDGTLTDPLTGITRCIRFAPERLGRKAPRDEDLLWCIGPPIRDSFAELLGSDGSDEIEAAIALYRERFGETGMFENELYDGISGLLAELLGTGHRLFVATSKLTVFARPILVHFGLDHWFEEVRGSELDGTNNAKVNLLRGLLEARSLDPAETVMIGDRRYDIEGARANAIAVAYGYGTEEELSAA